MSNYKNVQTLIDSVKDKTQMPEKTHKPISQYVIENNGFKPSNPLIVQGDRSLLLEVHNPLFETVRGAISPFAELEKSPEHIHTYRITPLSLWNAASAGLLAENIIEPLIKFAKYPVPQNVLIDIEDLASRWGRVRLLRKNGELVLESEDEALMLELSRNRAVTPYLGKKLSTQAFIIPIQFRGVLKQALITVGWPVEDLAGYTTGTSLDIALRENTFNLRDYQESAAEAFYLSGSERGGSGVIVLPCGAGKTIVGLTAMAKVCQSTLILTTSRTSIHQWQRELLEKTTLTAENIVEYQGNIKELGLVTLATYQMLTYRPDKTEAFPHMDIFNQHNWGLIIYDEVHMLPAPIFRVTAEVQARRRLGLTATLIREDGREGDVFSLIGPKKYDVPWREMEGQGWIAEAVCTEVRCSMPRSLRMDYAVAELREKFRIASENPTKMKLVKQILALHSNKPTIIIGQYIEQIKQIAEELKFPLITGKTTQKQRDKLYEQFRYGEISVLVLSKVGNFALDLPDAQILIQVSGTFGSRQEEAQRLGRVLRPKSNKEQAHFYTIVSRETEEEDFAHHRQLFLTEQGYSYNILDEEEL